MAQLAKPCAPCMRVAGSDVPICKQVPAACSTNCHSERSSLQAGADSEHFMAPELTMPPSNLPAGYPVLGSWLVCFHRQERALSRWGAGAHHAAADAGPHHPHLLPRHLESADRQPERGAMPTQGLSARAAWPVHCGRLGHACMSSLQQEFAGVMMMVQHCLASGWSGD